jgi:hypothetical protein
VLSNLAPDIRFTLMDWICVGVVFIPVDSFCFKDEPSVSAVITRLIFLASTMNMNDDSCEVTSVRLRVP